MSAQPPGTCKQLCNVFCMTQLLTKDPQTKHTKAYTAVMWLEKQGRFVQLGQILSAAGALDSRCCVATLTAVAQCRHTSQFLMIWLCLVPLGLWTVCQWFTPVVCCIVAFLLLGIENIGVQIEQPFEVSFDISELGCSQHQLPFLNPAGSWTCLCW